jgi:hypothetical protein
MRCNMADILDVSKECPRSVEIADCPKPVPRKEGIWFEIEKELDRGAHGVVYVAKDSDSKDIIVKLFSGPPKELEHEICYQHIASEQDVAPKVLDYWWCEAKENTALLVMDFGGNTTLENFLKEIANIEIKDLPSLKRALQAYPAMLALLYQTLTLNNKAGIFQYDLHLSNALVTIDENNCVTDLKIIDYGKSESCADVAKVVREKVCDSEPPEMFNGVAHVYKALFADLLMPLEFYVDEFIGHGSTPETPPKNPVLGWIYQDLIRQIQHDRTVLNHRSWSVDDVRDHLDDVCGWVEMDLPDHLVENYPDIVDESAAVELASQASQLPTKLQEQ